VGGVPQLCPLIDNFSIKPQHWFAQELTKTSIPNLISNFTNKGCVALWPCHLHFKKLISRQKKNYGNSNISPCKNIIFEKSSKRNQNLSRCSNHITNLKFQHKPKHHLSKNPHIKIDLLPR
jgi:hypothetical protein